ncbi:hypothetical protein [Leifsonia sp. NPDC058230]|uniref:hypothetical protein n=1 Tax=Leifsonia sp. NPDC058230 TaxID=3346391 RepID=UPI0036DAC6AA
MVRSIDTFYEVVGDRNWIFHGSLKLDTLQEPLASGMPDRVEQAILEQYADHETMRFALMRAKAVPELRPYRQLLDYALRDYREGRYYATVLSLLPVLDGFVAAVSDNRRGLHSLEEQKLIVWNSLVAHHQGLASTQQSFTRSFNTLNEEPLFELYRNGILHGNFSNFDNEIVASKAWNRLFALLDWREARIEASKPAPVEPTLLDSLKRVGKLEAQKKVLNEWQPRSSSVAEDGLSTVEREPVAQAAIGLLEAWKNRNYGVLAGCLHEFGKKPARGAYIGQVRERFERITLDNYSLVSVDMRGAGLGHVVVDLSIDGASRASELRFLYVDATGSILPESDPLGTWLSVGNDPVGIVGRTW